MLESSLTEQESQDLAGAGGAARQGRQWRRSRALQRLAENQAPQQVADVLGCSLASVYHWAAAWQQQGHMGLAEVKPAGRTRTLDVAALRLLEQWLEADPQTHGEQTTGWTVPLLPTRLRRAFQRLGWRWKRPKSVLTRPLTKKGALGARVQPVLAEGKEVWIGDETPVREFPPLRAAWAKRRRQQVGVISGRQGRRVIHGALKVQTGERVRVVGERSRTDGSQAFVEIWGQVWPDVPKWHIWDNAHRSIPSGCRRPQRQLRGRVPGARFARPNGPPVRTSGGSSKRCLRPTGRLPRWRKRPSEREPGLTASPTRDTCAGVACNHLNFNGYLLRRHSLVFCAILWKG